MAKKHINENYIHTCDSTQEEILSKTKSISQMGYTKEQFVEPIQGVCDGKYFE